MEHSAAVSFGDWVKRRRQALGLTQDELSRRVGCAVATIRKLESDERRPSVQMAERLADYLHLAPQERAEFLQCARLELAADRLPSPVQLPPPLPSGTITFLLIAFDAQAGQPAQHSQALDAARAHGRALVRQALAEHSGIVVAASGDIQAAFPLPVAAVVAAAAIQRAIQRAGRETADLLRARIALHTGVVTTRNGDYGGPPLNRATQLLDAAHGGQILLSRVTADLVSDDLPPDLALRDLGEHRLKDLSRREQVFQLVAADLPADFPPLQTLAVYATNLPAPPTPLIGRVQEVAQLHALLEHADVRLITLTGPGGIGKTRLGLRLAADLLDRFADGVYFVGLAAVRDPALVVVTIMQALGLKDAGKRPLLAQLQDQLRDKQMLLVLDNFEQVLSAAPQLAELLAATAQLKLLVTSRAALHLAGEREFAVPALELPPRHASVGGAGEVRSGWETLSQYEAVALFIVRAQAVKHDFVASSATAPAIAEICYRLDGLPLAIELAAARVKLFSPQALLARLSRPLAVLTSGTRDVPARQQTLRATIAWSYELLEPAERTLFRRLAVFVAGWTVEAAEAVAGALPAPVAADAAILDGLSSLLDKSMLRQDEGPDGEPRFLMLETIREFALEQLEPSAELPELRQRHASYYLALAELAEPQLTGPQQVRWLARLEAEHDNLRAALRWTCDTSAAEAALRLSGALWRFWDIHGYLDEGRAWLEQALALPDSGAATSVLRLKAFNGAGTLARRQSDYPRAAVLLERGLALSRELGDQRWLAVLLNSLALLTRRQGDSDRAVALLEESLGLSRALGDPRGVAAALGNLGALAHEQGDLARAWTLHEESLVIARSLCDQRGMAEGLNNLGTVLHHQGDLAGATALQEESLALYRELGDRYGVALLLYNLSERLHLGGDSERARAYLHEGLVLFQALGEKEGCVEHIERLARLDGAEDQPERAARLWGAAAAARDAFGTPMRLPERADHEAAVAAVRARLGDAAFTAAWAVGRTLSLERAIAEALAH